MCVYITIDSLNPPYEEAVQSKWMGGSLITSLYWVGTSLRGGLPSSSHSRHVGGGHGPGLVYAVHAKRVTWR